MDRGAETRVKLLWHPSADQDFAELILFIAEDDLTAALRVEAEILRQVALLADYPMIGREGRVRNTRELVILGTPYLVAYRVTQEDLEVLSIFHGARRWPQRF